MKDIPVFTTENGAASLTLKDIPYRQEAYIKLQSSLAPLALLEECVAFCRMCGAERIYASGDPVLEDYPLHTAVLRMQCHIGALPDTDAALFPVQQQTLTQWLAIYNEKMASVPNAAWMTENDGKTMLAAGEGYFVHRNGALLGIGRASAGKIGAIAAAVPGAGKDVVCALCHALTTDTAYLEAASANERAIRLYERLGFVKTAELSRWYRVSL